MFLPCFCLVSVCHCVGKLVPGSRQSLEAVSAGEVLEGWAFCVVKTGAGHFMILRGFYAFHCVWMYLGYFGCLL